VIWTKKWTKNRTDSAKKNHGSTSFQSKYVKTSDEFVFRTMKGSHWTLNHGVLGRISESRVRVQEHGTTAQRKKERKNENEPKRVISPFIRALGSGQPKPDPLSSLFGRWIQILMDLGQSNAPGALVWSGSIRSVGLGLYPWALGLSFIPFWFPCYSHLYACCLHLFLIKILSKIPEKFTICFLMDFQLFYGNFILWSGWKACALIFVWFTRFRCFFANFLALWWIHFFCSMELIFDMWFCDVFTSEFMLFLHSCLFNC